MQTSDIHHRQSAGVDTHPALFMRVWWRQTQQWNCKCIVVYVMEWATVTTWISFHSQTHTHTHTAVTLSHTSKWMVIKRSDGYNSDSLIWNIGGNTLMQRLREKTRSNSEPFMWAGSVSRTVPLLIHEVMPFPSIHHPGTRLISQICSAGRQQCAEHLQCPLRGIVETFQPMKGAQKRWRRSRSLMDGVGGDECQGWCVIGRITARGEGKAKETVMRLVTVCGLKSGGRSENSRRWRFVCVFTGSDQKRQD